MWRAEQLFLKDGVPVSDRWYVVRVPVAADGGAVLAHVHGPYPEKSYAEAFARLRNEAEAGDRRAAAIAVGDEVVCPDGGPRMRVAMLGAGEFEGRVYCEWSVPLSDTDRGPGGPASDQYAGRTACWFPAANPTVVRPRSFVLS